MINMSFRVWILMLFSLNLNNGVQGWEGVSWLQKQISVVKDLATKPETTTVSAMCNLLSVTDCNSYDTVEQLSFHAFISRDKFAESCRKFNTALECIYQEKFMKGCSIHETFYYDMQRDVIQTVCKNDGEYMKHIDCLGNQTLKHNVDNECITSLTQGHINCLVLMHTRECITFQTEMVCGQEEKPYMDLLAYRFLQPYANKIKCSMPKPVFTATPSTNQPSTSTDVTATGKTTRETTKTRKSTKSTTTMKTTRKTTKTTTMKTTTESSSSRVTMSALVLFIAAKQALSLFLHAIK